MIRKTKLRATGGSISAILPKDILARHQLRADDEVFVRDTPEGLLITPYDAETAAMLAASIEVAREDRDAMAALAKL
jgi:antitoxin component of MazEF toxin-antitoxin module